MQGQKKEKSALPSVDKFAIQQRNSLCFQELPMHVAASSVLIVLLLVVGSDAVTTPTSQCSYLTTYYQDGKPLVPSLVPSISSGCLAAYNSGNRANICIAECQSWYSVLTQCMSPDIAGVVAASRCGQFNKTSCDTLAQNKFNGLSDAVSTACGANYTYCSPNCSAAIAALEQYSGCCSADELNGPKLVCGQQPIAPCSTLLSGSTPAPTSDCVYLVKYGLKAAALNGLASVNAECTKRLAIEGDINPASACIAECRSLFVLFETCVGTLNSNAQAGYMCGKFNNKNCSDLESLTNPEWVRLLTGWQLACSNSTYCTNSCVNAIAAMEQYGGCCFSYFLNGPKALCGQQPVAPCTTIVSSDQLPVAPSSSSGSAAIKFNFLIVMIFMLAVGVVVYF